MIFIIPARRALENDDVTTWHKLSEYMEEEILKFHGMGPASLPELRNALENIGLEFRKK